MALLLQGVVECLYRVQRGQKDLLLWDQTDDQLTGCLYHHREEQYHQDHGIDRRVHVA
jgi:hypothetical protein